MLTLGAVSVFARSGLEDVPSAFDSLAAGASMSTIGGHVQYLLDEAIREKLLSETLTKTIAVSWWFVGSDTLIHEGISCAVMEYRGSPEVSEGLQAEELEAWRHILHPLAPST